MIESGLKYKTKDGIHAIKDGVSSKKQSFFSLRKPKWLHFPTQKLTKNFLKLRSISKINHLVTVCEEAKCPNINECWSYGVATVMLMGKICTRACSFCAVDTGNPKGILDAEEPKRVANSIYSMNLKYVVLTSVDRDDLIDGGAGHYVSTVHEIKKLLPSIRIEVLIPDFRGKQCVIDKLISTDISVFAQNIETVYRLTSKVRDIRAGYWQTMNLLKYIKSKRSGAITKSSLMLGLGETEDEIISTMDDLRCSGVDILTMGQYLQPTKNHLPVVKFVSPQEFQNYRKIGLQKGFLEVASGPMVRSSYRADRVFNKNNLGM